MKSFISKQLALTILQHNIFQDNDTTALAPHHHQALHHDVQARAELPQSR